MFSKIAAFEFRYQFRHPLFWITSILFFLLGFAFIVIPDIHVGGEGNVHRNSPFALAESQLYIAFFYMFVTTAFVSGVVVRDDETGFGPILRTTGVSKFDYLIGRFVGALAPACIGFIAVPLGLFVGALMPWVDPDTLGPNKIAYYAYTYLVFGLPVVVITAAIFFAVSTATRSRMGAYLGVVGFLVAWTVANAIIGSRPDLRVPLAIGEPLGLEAFLNATRYWTAADRNTLLPPLEGPLLWNKAVVLAATVVIVWIAYLVFRFETRGVRPKKRQALEARAGGAAVIQPALRSLPKPVFNAATARAQLFKRMRFEMAQVFLSPVYPILLAVGLFNSIGPLWFTGEFLAAHVYPVTRVMIVTLQDGFVFVAPVIAAFYAGELVWRERDRKIHEIIGASALPDWALVFPKMLAVALVLASTLAISAIAAIIVQALKGFDNFEFSKYVLWYLLPQTIDWTMIAILAVFFQCIAPHKFVGWGLMILFLIARLSFGAIGLDHNLYLYAGHPATPLSDMNGLGHYWIAAYWFRLYWASFATILMILSYALWRRGAEVRFWPRLRRLPQVLGGTPGLVAGFALVVFVATGGFIYYNTNILNTYETQADKNKRLADEEKQLLRFEHLPQPTTTSVKLNLDLYPRERRLVTHGTYVLENRTGAPLQTLHLQLLDRGVKYLNVSVPGAHLERDYKEFDYRIYRFDTPLAPGATTTLNFTTLRQERGFKNSDADTRVVENGTFVNNGYFAPIIGFSRTLLLKDRATRRKYGLPPELRQAKLEDDSARDRNYVGNAKWVMADTTVTTDADQTPIAPGYKVRDVTANGRRTVEFKTDAPILQFFSVQSARYVEKHQLYKGIDIAVYYDKAHPYNVDRMIRAAEHGLDYYQANFSPYQFRQFRFIEFPAYGGGAQSFANTVPWSEGLDFIADVRNPADIDTITYVGAHELGHQWWGHQVISAEMQGGTMLVETLAQYSAIMVMEKTYGPDQIRKFLKGELDAYLKARAGEAFEEVPLERVENQAYIHYNKGSLVMYLLQDQIGEDAVNRALRKLLAQYAFKGPPYASSKDLVALFRAEAPPDKQQLITDLFEKITLFDLKATKLVVKKRRDGKYDVSLTVDARKMYANGKGKETPAPLGGYSFDIGLFTAEPGKTDFTSKSVILFKRTMLKGGVQTLTFVTDKAPTWGGVDPYNKYIVRDSDANVVAASD